MKQKYFIGLWIAILCIQGVLAVESDGVYHSLKTDEAGNVWVMGRGDYGQLGNGNTATNYEWTKVEGVSNIVAVSAGGFHSLALAADGTLYGWGSNKDGQLVSGGERQYTRPIIIGTGFSGATLEGGSTFTRVYKEGNVQTQGVDQEGFAEKERSTFTDKPVTVVEIEKRRAEQQKKGEDAAKAENDKIQQEMAKRKPKGLGQAITGQVDASLLQRITELEQLVQQLKSQIVSLQSGESGSLPTIVKLNKSEDIVVTLN